MPQIEPRATLSFDRRGMNGGEADAMDGGGFCKDTLLLDRSIDMKEMTDERGEQATCAASNENGVSFPPSPIDSTEREVRIAGRFAYDGQ